MSYLMRKQFLSTMRRGFSTIQSLRPGIFHCRHCLNARLIQTVNSDTVGNNHLNQKLGASGMSKCLWNEMKAFSNLLQRSGFHNNHDVLHLFGVGGSRHFSTSSPCQQQHQQSQEDPDKDKDEKDKENDDKMPMLPRLVLWFWLLVAAYTGLKMIGGDRDQVYKYISWNEFYYDMLAKGEVQEIVVQPETETAIIHLYPEAVIKGRKSEFSFYPMKIPDPTRFEEKVRKAEAELGINSDKGVPVSYNRSTSWAPLFFLGLIGLTLFLLLRNVKVSIQTPDIFAVRKAKFVRVDVLSQQGKGVSFKDVAGLQEAKVEVMEFVDYVKNPQRFKEIGAKIPHGALLLGPPGCGKTLLAKAVATEARVPFLAMAGSEFVEIVGGLGAARVRDLFKEAKKRAPCIVYIDEIDAIGRKRSGSSFGGNAEEEQTLNQLLVEMDGMTSLEGVIMLASTNRADILDKALLRPGRFDRHIMIDLPTLAERNEIFEMYLRKLKTSHLPQAYAPKLAQLSPGMSGADIANICNEAAIHAARDCKKVIDGSDFEYAVERVVAGVEKKTRLLSPTEKKVVAYHESGHALVGWLLKYTDALLRISIVPRTNSALGFAQYMPSDQKLYSTDELFERMCMALGGRAAEAIIFNHVTTGAQDDLQKVTKMAMDQIKSYGMNEEIGVLSFPSQSSGELGTKPYSKRLGSLMDEEARALVNRAYHHTEQILSNNKDKLHTLASTLLKMEILTYDDIEKLIGPPPFGKKNTMEPIGWEGIMPENTENVTERTKRRKPKRNRDYMSGR